MLHRFFKRFLFCDLGIYSNFIKFAQILFVHPFQAFCHIHISIQKNITVGWMIIFSMECQEIFIRKIRDTFRISARFHAIWRIRKEYIKNLTFKHLFGRRKCPLHLVVYNTVVF